MYFPSDMNFQYFFFSTYPGYFLQIFPVALISGVAYWIIKYRKDNAAPLSRKIWSTLFVCYITGTLCLVLALDVIGIIWYQLLYHMPSGRDIQMFAWDFNFVPDFFTHLDSEMIANVLLFLPFGILYPLSKKGATWKKTILIGFLYSLGIEVFQPVFGRAFDINDIILNTFGITISASIIFSVKKIVAKNQQKGENKFETK